MDCRNSLSHKQLKILPGVTTFFIKTLPVGVVDMRWFERKTVKQKDRCSNPPSAVSKLEQFRSHHFALLCQ